LNHAHEFLNENQSKLLFVMGTGRSGTQLLSDLLRSAGPAAVFHEPNFREDVGTMDLLRRDLEMARRYWRTFRGVEVYRRWMAEPQAAFYAEVNGTIRYQAEVIRELYPRAKMLLIVRDGRGVVRSVMGWQQFYGPRSRGAYAIAPLPGDPYHDLWSSMGRFEKICWSWMDSNERLMRCIPEGYWCRLEAIATDYDYFSERFIQPTNLDIDRILWRTRMAQRSRNATRQYAFPAWEEWSTDQMHSFERICGDTMRKLGYEC